MGQTYYVKAKIDVQDEAGFINSGKQILESPRIYLSEGSQIDTVEHQMETVLAAHQHGFSKEGNEYTSEFDASYGWEGVLHDFFVAVKGSLNKGSYIVVYPDSETWKMEV